MQPRPMAETSRLLLPSLRFSIGSPFETPGAFTRIVGRHTRGATLAYKLKLATEDVRRGTHPRQLWAQHAFDRPELGQIKRNGARAATRGEFSESREWRGYGWRWNGLPKWHRAWLSPPVAAGATSGPCNQGEAVDDQLPGIRPGERAD